MIPLPFVFPVLFCPKGHGQREEGMLHAPHLFLSIHVLLLFFVSIDLLRIGAPWPMSHSTTNTKTKTHNNATTQLVKSKHTSMHPSSKGLISFFFFHSPLFFFRPLSSFSPPHFYSLYVLYPSLLCNCKLQTADCNLQNAIAPLILLSIVHFAFRSFFLSWFGLFCFASARKTEEGWARSSSLASACEGVKTSLCMLVLGPFFCEGWGEIDRMDRLKRQEKGGGK